VSNPLDEFQRWFDDARAAGDPQPETMALATATPDGHPSVRFVLYRGLSGAGPEQGLRFFTNYESRKAGELAANAVAAVALYWHAISRQVRVEGRIRRLDAAASDAYFAARPRGSQLAAWASPQSRPLPHAELEARYAALEASYEGRPVPRPPNWGGFLLVPDRLELWEGHTYRLHRRRLYTRAASGGWQMEELAP
jgi:pyridoxamine 5'-phosphate oxidase